MVDATENKPVQPTTSCGPKPRAATRALSPCPVPGCFADVLRRTPASCWRPTASLGHPRLLGPPLCLQLKCRVGSGEGRDHPPRGTAMPSHACPHAAVTGSAAPKGRRWSRAGTMLGCGGQQSRARRAAGGGDTAGTVRTSHLPALLAEGEGAERGLSFAGRGDPTCSAGAAPARSKPGGRRVPAHSWRRMGAAGWRPGIFRSFSSLSAEAKERPGFICHSGTAALSRRRRVMSLRHRPMPSGQNATRSLETEEYRAASESRAERRARRRDQQILTALWLGRSAGAGGAWGDGWAGSGGAGTLLTLCRVSLWQGQLPRVGWGAAGRSWWGRQDTECRCTSRLRDADARRVPSPPPCQQHSRMLCPAGFPSSPTRPPGHTELPEHPLPTAAPQAVATGPPQRESHPSDTCTGHGVRVQSNTLTCPDESRSKEAPRGVVPTSGGVPKPQAAAKGQVPPPPPRSSLPSRGRCPARGANRAAAIEHHGHR